MNLSLLIDAKMPEFGLFLVVIQYPASFIFFLCLVICYVTTYKSILDKLGKKQNRIFFLSNYY